MNLPLNSSPAISLDIAGIDLCPRTLLWIWFLTSAIQKSKLENLKYISRIVSNYRAFVFFTGYREIYEASLIYESSVYSQSSILTREHRDIFPLFHDKTLQISHRSGIKMEWITYALWNTRTGSRLQHFHPLSHSGIGSRKREKRLVLAFIFECYHERVLVPSNRYDDYQQHPSDSNPLSL